MSGMDLKKEWKKGNGLKGRGKRREREMVGAGVEYQPCCHQREAQ